MFIFDYKYEEEKIKLKINDYSNHPEKTSYSKGLKLGTMIDAKYVRGTQEPCSYPCRTVKIFTKP